MEDGKRGDLGAHALWTVVKNLVQDLGHAQIQHRSMMEMIVSVTVRRTQHVSNHIVQVTFIKILVRLTIIFNGKHFCF